MTARMSLSRLLLVLGVAGGVVTAGVLLRSGRLAAGEVPTRAATAEEAPIWTSRPVRIDRSRETRERLPGRLPAPILRLRADVFPQVREDASFLAEGRRWRIAHVVLPERSRTCPFDGGRQWPCGARAWAQFSGLVSGARLVCDRPPVMTEVAPELECRLSSGRSIAELLLESGWAEADLGAPPELVELSRTAREAGRGLFSPMPPR